MGLSPSFFLFLLMAAVAALVVAGDAVLLLLPLPFAGADPAAPVIDGVLVTCACACVCTEAFGS